MGVNNYQWQNRNYLCGRKIISYKASLLGFHPKPAQEGAFREKLPLLNPPKSFIMGVNNYQWQNRNYLCGRKSIACKVSLLGVHPKPAQEGAFREKLPLGNPPKSFIMEKTYTIVFGYHCFLIQKLVFQCNNERCNFLWNKKSDTVKKHDAGFIC